MGFIQDRFQETARWILNPRVFWNGFQLSSYLESEGTLSTFELNSLRHAQYDWRRHLDLVTNFEEVLILDKLSDTLTAIANSPPTTFWELKTNHHKSWNPKLSSPDLVLPGFSLLSSNRTKAKLLRNIYSNDTLQAWIHSNNNAAVESMSNEPTDKKTIWKSDKNTNYADWITRMLYCVNVGVKERTIELIHTMKSKIEINSTNMLLITSLPNFLISKSIMISDFPEDELGLPDNTDDMEFNLSISPGKQYQTFDLLPPILINPQWLHITGWADLWTGTLPTQTFITTMNHSATCRFCIDSNVECETCEEGLTECAVEVIGLRNVKHVREMEYKSVLLMDVNQDKRQFVNCVRVQDGKTIFEPLSVMLAKVKVALMHVIVPLVRVKVLAHVIMSVMKG